MTDQVKGPAAYFPSIEKKYGRPIAEWQQVIRDSCVRTSWRPQRSS